MQETWKQKMDDGYISPHRGRTLTKKHREKLSESHKKEPLKGHDKKICSCYICKSKKGETAGKNNSFYGKKHSKKTRDYLSKIKQGELNNRFGTQHKDESIEKMLNTFWATMKKRLNNQGKFGNMTKPEFQMKELLDKNFPGEWGFNGCLDCDVIINKMVPDFININGRKIVIEVFGDYWHKDEDENQRIRQYKEFGYQCVVLWEADLNRDIEQTIKDGVIDV